MMLRFLYVSFLFVIHFSELCEGFAIERISRINSMKENSGLEDYTRTDNKTECSMECDDADQECYINDVLKEAFCRCKSGLGLLNGNCVECTKKCEDNQLCSFGEDGRPFCKCFDGLIEINGNCEECFLQCNDDEECYFNDVLKEVFCGCKSGMGLVSGICVECTLKCEDNQLCSFDEDGRPFCKCFDGLIEIKGNCEEIHDTTSTVNKRTNSSTSVGTIGGESTETLSGEPSATTVLSTAVNKDESTATTFSSTERNDDDESTATTVTSAGRSNDDESTATTSSSTERNDDDESTATTVTSADRSNDDESTSDNGEFIVTSVSSTNVSNDEVSRTTDNGTSTEITVSSTSISNNEKSEIKDDKNVLSISMGSAAGALIVIIVILFTGMKIKRRRGQTEIYIQDSETSSQRSNESICSAKRRPRVAPPPVII